MHETAFQEWGSVPEEILYDRMRTIWTGADERGEIIWNGKVECGVKYVRRNFLCGLQGREPANLTDVNAELRRRVAEVANQRVHGTTREQVFIRWDEDQFAMQLVNGRPPYPFMDDEQRKVTRDAYVS
jgi:transposase